jgi:Glycosyl transferase family 2
MRLAVVISVRDERDIIALFLAHITKLFDLIFIVDHRSVDGTELALNHLSKKTDFFRYKLNTSGPHLPQVSYRLVKEAFSKGADFVFFLDADEFVRVQNRADLEEALVRQSSPLLELRWQKVVVDGLVKQENLLSPESIFNVPTSQTSKIGKVIVSRRFYDENDEFELTLGNHAIRDTAGNKFAASVIGEILHVPYRSRGQIARKLILSTLIKNSQLTLKCTEAGHYQVPLETFSDTGLSDEQIFYLATAYAGTWSIGEFDQADLCPPAFEKKSFNDVSIDRETFEEVNKVMNDAPSRTETQLLAGYISSFRMEAPTYYRFEIDGENICAIRDNKLNATNEETDLVGILTTENNRLLIESQTVHRQSRQIQEGFSELRNEIANLHAILQNERTGNGALEDERNALKAETVRLTSRLEEVKRQNIEDRITIQTLKDEVEHRGNVLDKKRAELAQYRANTIEPV